MTKVEGAKFLYYFRKQHLFDDTCLGWALRPAAHPTYPAYQIIDVIFKSARKLLVNEFTLGCGRITLD